MSEQEKTLDQVVAQAETNIRMSGGRWESFFLKRNLVKRLKALSERYSAEITRGIAGMCPFHSYSATDLEYLNTIFGVFESQDFQTLSASFTTRPQEKTARIGRIVKEFAHTVAYHQQYCTKVSEAVESLMGLANHYKHNDTMFFALTRNIENYANNENFLSSPIRLARVYVSGEFNSLITTFGEQEAIEMADCIRSDFDYIGENPNNQKLLEIYNLDEFKREIARHEKGSKPRMSLINRVANIARKGQKWSVDRYLDILEAQQEADEKAIEAVYQQIHHSTLGDSSQNQSTLVEIYKGLSQSDFNPTVIHTIGNYIRKVKQKEAKAVQATIEREQKFLSDRILPRNYGAFAVILTHMDERYGGIIKDAAETVPEYADSTRVKWEEALETGRIKSFYIDLRQQSDFTCFVNIKKDAS